MTAQRKTITTAIAAALAITLSSTLGIGKASAESPFHTGVWQVNTPQGPVGLVVSDWLIYENGLPTRWIYRRSGSNDENQFDFLVRRMGQASYDPVAIRIYRTGDHEMNYTLHESKKDPVKNPSIRLSVPNYKNSCLSVENKGERLFGTWLGTSASSMKRLRMSKDKLTIDGNTQAVEIRSVRVGRLAILQNGQPIAFFTDGGGDYGVFQRLKPGVTLAQISDPRREILDFASEEIVRDPKGTCDRQIADRLKLLGKKK